MRILGYIFLLSSFIFVMGCTNTNNKEIQITSMVSEEARTAIGNKGVIGNKLLKTIELYVPTTFNINYKNIKDKLKILDTLYYSGEAMEDYHKDSTIEDFKNFKIKQTLLKYSIDKVEYSIGNKEGTTEFYEVAKVTYTATYSFSHRFQGKTMTKKNIDVYELTLIYDKTKGTWLIDELLIE